MKIVIFGHVCIDHNVSEGKVFTGAGSPAMFMHRIFSQLSDCTVTIIAPYGQDFVPYIGMTRLYPESAQSIHTMIYENTVVHGVRTQRCLQHETAQPIAIDDTIRNIIATADSICIAPLAPNFPPSYIEEIIKSKKWRTDLTLLPQGYFRQFTVDNEVEIRDFTEDLSIIPLMDTVIISDTDHADAKEVATKWAAMSKATVIMTQAEHGATVFSGTETESLPTIPVPDSDIVSSIGAGDIFSAGYIYSYAKHHDVKKAVTFANALARQCLSFTPDAIRIDLTTLPV